VLEQLDLHPRSQSGAIALFGKDVVKDRGLVDADYHSMLSKYQAKRQEADYEKIFLDDRSDAEAFFEDAEMFVARMQELLEDL